MTFDYNELEIRLVEVCKDVHETFLRKFNANTAYLSAGAMRLEAFLQQLQQEFDAAAVKFLKLHNLQNDPQSKRHALTITKLYAKKCMEDFSRVEA